MDDNVSAESPASPYCAPECRPHQSTFCPDCGRADKKILHSLRLMGPVGVQHSNSPKIEEFWKTGDPSVFDSPR